MPRVKQNLSVAEKLAILKGAQKLLGPKGENWIRGHWFGQRTSKAGSRPVAPAVADCWCLLGALEESAYRLGLSERRSQSGVLGRLTSLRALARERLSPANRWYRRDAIYLYNDDESKTWRDIKKLLNDRIKQLQAEEK